MEYRQFLDGVNRKEDKAWVELYDYFYAPLCCYAAKIMGNDQMVEDVVQGCFVKLWLSTVCFEDIKVITAYLYRAVYNAALNFVRDQKRSKKAHEVWMGQVVSDESDAVEMALEEEAITRFYTVITRLPEQQRDILLRSMKGERVRDMAEKLGISENTMKTQKKRASQLFFQEFPQFVDMRVIRHHGVKVDRDQQMVMHLKIPLDRVDQVMAFHHTLATKFR